MTDIHSCSYYCDRPECVRRQRDEMRGKLGDGQAERVPPSLIRNLQEILEKINTDSDGENYLNLSCDALDMIDAFLLFPDVDDAQPVATLVNRKDADGGKTTTFIRPTSLGMDLPLGEYPLHLHPPPSAPVGVKEGWYRYNKPAPRWEDTRFGAWLDPAVYGPPSEKHGYSLEVATLAQQPAVVNEAGIYWRAMYRLQTAMRYMDNNPKLTLDRAFEMADEDVARLTAAVEALTFEEFAAQCCHSSVTAESVHGGRDDG